MTRAEHRDEALRLLHDADLAESVYDAEQATARAQVHALLALSADEADVRTVFTGGEAA